MHGLCYNAAAARINGEIMIKYEQLPTTTLTNQGVQLRTASLPELVHLDDPAFSVMSDFNIMKPYTIKPTDSMDDALNEMKVNGQHFLLVVDQNQHVSGIIASEDLLGAKPIKIIQERRIQRSMVLVNMLMVPLSEITAFDVESLQPARVGNVVTTMKQLSTHYALAISHQDGKQYVRGLFNTSQISKQLHIDIATEIAKAETVSELSKRADD